MYGWQLLPITNIYTVVNLGFNFAYFGTDYSTVSISTNGYVCLGVNMKCDMRTRPSPYDVLVGLNSDPNPTRKGSGQIYFKNLCSNDFYIGQSYSNLLDPTFSPTNIFMITYDNVLPFDRNGVLNSKVSFQMFLLTDCIKSFVILKYNLCPADLTLWASSGLNYNNKGKLEELLIDKERACLSSNVNQMGVWATQVTNNSYGMLSII